MSKILYIVDCSLRQYHSVRDILYNILNHPEMHSHEQVLARYYGTLYHPLQIDHVEGYKTYSTPNLDAKSILASSKYSKYEKAILLLKRAAFTLLQLPRIKYLYRDWSNIRYYTRILDLESPDLVIYFAISPSKNFSKICAKKHIPYISLLYDTFIERPLLDQEQEYPNEKYAIQNAIGYFVPTFFFDGYLKYYSNSNIYPFDLPLLVDKADVLNAYSSSFLKYDFTYFGQMQSFRNGDHVKTIFKELKLSLALP